MIYEGLSNVIVCVNIDMLMLQNFFNPVEPKNDIYPRYLRGILSII